MPSPRHEIWIDSVRRRQLAEAVSFVDSIHHHIDPDFFSIDPAELEIWTAVLDGDDPDRSVSVELSYQELFRLDNIVSAAWEYFARERRPVGAMDDESFRDLLAWISRLEDRLFRRPD